jgi:hypothetical protein
LNKSLDHATLLICNGQSYAFVLFCGTDLKPGLYSWKAGALLLSHASSPFALVTLGMESPELFAQAILPIRLPK